MTTDEPKKGKVIPISSIHHYSHFSSGMVKLEVGKHYWLGRRYVRLIRTTRKGFNFLDEEKSRCVFRHKHLYAPKYSGRNLPEHQTVFWIRVPADLYLREVSTAV